MPVGGMEVVLPAPAQECIGDIILRACRRHWPGETCYFQDVTDEENVYSLNEPWVWLRGTTSKEFFVYRNRAAVEAWADGPTAANVNSMLHFIIGAGNGPDRDTVETTVVFDRLTKDVRFFLDDLQSTFLSTAAGMQGRGPA
jgi:hypothetical protein